MATPQRYLPSRRFPACAYLPGDARDPTASARRARARLVATGAGEDPVSGAPAPVLDEHNWHDHTMYMWGVDLHNHGYPWEAHEVWEALWRVAAPGSPVRALLQGLIQSAAAVIQARTGHLAGLRTLAARAAGKFQHVTRTAGPWFLGMDVARFDRSLGRYAAARPVVPDAWPIIELALPGARGSDRDRL